MQNTIENLGSFGALFAIIVFSIAYVHGFRATFAAIRSIRFSRLRLPDAIKCEVRAALHSIRIKPFPRHRMSRHYGDACDW